MSSHRARSQRSVQRIFALRFSLACLCFSFLFRGVQRGYFSFQRERSEITKVDELLISAEELPWRKPIPLADHSSMSALAIMHKSRDTLGCDYSANCMMSPLIVPTDHLPRNSRKS